MKKLTIYIILAQLVCFSSLLVGVEASAADPDQVLVLYNMDWTQDLPGTEPGQDSLEVAKYYVEKHTDPATGKKPYVLGLHCMHGGKNHLNEKWLKEKSNDNQAGIVHITNDVRKTEMIRDSRIVEIRIADEKSQADWNSLNVSLEGEMSEKTWIVRDGVPPEGMSVLIEPLLEKGTGKRIAFNAWTLLSGKAWVTATVKRRDGNKPIELRETYHDFMHFVPSRTGPDGIRDDQYYLDDVENQVKRFVENPKNALSDGTLLKDHILYTVVCYGLPRVVEATYGISRGITQNLRNHGDLSSMEQRLALLYYDIEEMVKFRIGVFRAESNSPFKSNILRTNLCKPMAGNYVNPYLHPWTFKKKMELTAAWPEVPHFTSVWRKRPENLDRFLYVVTRLDGDHPSQALSQIDSAVYATKYLTQGIGGPQGTSKKLFKAKQKTDNVASSAQEFLRNLGYKNVAQSQYPGGRLQFNRLEPQEPFFNQEPIYLPGGIAHVVKSNNNWDDGRPFPVMLARGVAFTGGAACIWGGPHTTSHSWWDDDVLFHYLLKGYDLGESILMSSLFLGWITSLVGDPLYKPDQSRTNADHEPPRPASKPSIEVIPGATKDVARLSVPLVADSEQPEVAQIRVTFWTQDRDPVKEASNLFSSRPEVWLSGLKPNLTYSYRYELIDPYGNVYRSGNNGKVLSLRTSERIPERRIVYRANRKQAKYQSLILATSTDETKRKQLNLHLGEMILSFKLPAQPKGTLHLIKGREFSLTLNGQTKRLYFQVAGGAAMSSPLDWNHKLRTVLLQWSKWPTVRQVYVMRGTDMKLIGSCSSPWNVKNQHDRIEFEKDGKRVSWEDIEVFRETDINLQNTYPES